jgi:lipopolysaccharide biosynthesis glycosyltransferase
VYYRLLLPELLDAPVEKVLYLDCDLVVKDSLLPLWEMPLGDRPVAAVAEPHFSRHEALGLPGGAPYFNSGVMLINLSAWRQLRVTEQCIGFLQAHPDKIEFWDQDALNVVLAGNWLPLHPRWNQQTIHFEPQKHRFPLDEPVLAACLAHPAIIHYSAKFKPWHDWCDHPRKGEYYHYLAATEWKNFTPGGRKTSGLRRMLSRFLSSV